MLTAHLPSLELFLPLPSVEKFAKQASPHVSSGFCLSLFALLFLDVLFNGFQLCLWFMANFRENLSKLVESLQTSVNGD